MVFKTPGSGVVGTGGASIPVGGFFIPPGGPFGLTPGSVTKTVKALTPSELLIARLVKQRPKDGETTDAEAIWGKASKFNITDANFGDGENVNVLMNQDDESIKHLEIPIATIEFEEVSREEEKIRVTNPQDDSQYVDVMRALSITIKGPDLRPAETLTGNVVYDNTIAGNLAKVNDFWAQKTGGEMTKSGIPKATRPPYAFYKITFKYPDSSS